MIILRLFSKKKEDNGSNVIKTTGTIGAGLGIGKLGQRAVKQSGEKLKKDLIEDFKDSNLKKENKKLLDELAKDAKRQGTDVKHLTRAGYIDPKTKKEVIEDPRILSRHSYYDRKKDLIVSGDRADIFAHELGHSKHYKGRDGSRLGKIAHKLHGNHPSMMSLAGLSGFTSGVLSGMVEDNDSVGKGAKRLNTATGYLPAALTLTGLGAEIAATKRGFKALKSHGASKEYLEMAKKSMKHARNTYIGSSALSFGITTASRSTGKAVGRYVAKKEKESKEKKQL